MTGYEDLIAMDCVLVSTYPTSSITSSTNVSAQYRMICIYAIALFSLNFLTSFFSHHKSTHGLAALFGCVGCLGFLAWFITAQVFLYQPTGWTCGWETSVQEWNDMYNFQWNSILAFYCAVPVLCVAGCLRSMFCKPKDMNSASLLIAADQASTPNY